jgi:hypothetical protein
MSLPEEFNDLLKFTDDALQCIQFTQRMAQASNYEEWDEKELMHYKILSLLTIEHAYKFTSVEEPGIRWLLGCFVVKYNDTPFLVTVPRNLKNSCDQRFTLTKINKCFKEMGYKECCRKLASRIFENTVFGKYGERVQQQMIIRHISKQYDLMDNRNYPVTTNLTKQ